MKKREFALFSRLGRTDSRFTSLREAGRLDIVYECIEASLFVSHGIRRNVILHILLNGPPNPPLHLKIDGSLLTDVRTDQDTWKTILKRVLSGHYHPGISVTKSGFEPLIRKKAKSSKIYILEEGGKDISETKIGKNPVFVLGDHVGLPKRVEGFALRYGKKFSLGKQRYLAASCITILNYLLDRTVT
ncbi:MAG: tRNA (pseudouridine(54)-N(1))-methyltransferase TrmY [Candidatus Bathyarchaeota archaeon]